MTVSESMGHLSTAKTEYFYLAGVLDNTSQEADTVDTRLGTMLEHFKMYEGMDATTLLEGVRKGIAQAKTHADQGFGPLESAAYDLQDPLLTKARRTASMIRDNVSPAQGFISHTVSFEKQCAALEADLDTLLTQLRFFTTTLTAVRGRSDFLTRSLAGEAQLSLEVAQHIDKFQEDTDM
jgi:hypothetical protein